jgi:hypothetical protein
VNIIRKDATITPTGSDDDFPGTFEVVLSAPTKDRDGDTLLPDEWKQPLPEHVTFDSDHGMSVATTVGSGAPRIDEKTGNLIVSGTFSSLPRAQEVRTLVNEGHIRTTSVAFMSEKSQKDGKTVAVRELLNGAFVAIPSNREALVMASKSFVAKAGARNSASDLAHMQNAHDSLVAAGAECAPLDAEAKSPTERAEVKSVVGSLEATQDRVRDALGDAYPGRWPWLRATLPTEVIFEMSDPDDGGSETYRQSYTDDGSVVTLTGDAAPVDVMEVVAPDPDESTEKPAAADDGAAAADAAAASKSAAADADLVAAVQVRAAKIRLLASLSEGK